MDSIWQSNDFPLTALSQDILALHDHTAKFGRHLEVFLAAFKMYRPRQKLGAYLVVVAGHLRQAAIHVLQQASHGGLPKIDNHHLAGLCLQKRAPRGSGMHERPREFLK